MATGSHVVPAVVEGVRYDIVIEPGLLSRVGERMGSLNGSKKAVLVTDSQVGPLYAKRVADSLKTAGIDVIVVTMGAGENHKTLQELSRIYDALLAHKIERTTPILALGGGIVGDMAGFAAATVLRGVPFVQVPTTLLAMVDASIGGKTGVNHPAGKNLIGAFHQPIGVLIDPEALETLPPRELRGGLAECIKHDIIRDAKGFERLEEMIDRALALDVPALADLIAHNVRIKAQVVEADPLEKGERAHLNFGHTFGHAIENVSHYDWTHGECVALGMVAASRMAADLGMLDEASRRRIVAVIERAGLPARGLTHDTNEIVEKMFFDKKVKAGRLRFVLPDRIGHVIVRDDIPADAVHKALDSLRG